MSLPPDYRHRTLAGSISRGRHARGDAGSGHNFVRVVQSIAIAMLLARRRALLCPQLVIDIAGHRRILDRSHPTQTAIQ